VMRPRLVGQETGMHDLMVFFSTLGGISMFGPMGFIVGPLVAALFLALLDIYSAEILGRRQEGGLPAAAVPPALPELEGVPPPPEPSPPAPLPSPPILPHRERGEGPARS
jgi:hypothetical protein